MLGQDVYARIAADVRARFQLSPAAPVPWQAALTLWYTSEAGARFLALARAAVEMGAEWSFFYTLFWGDVVEALEGLPRHNGSLLSRMIDVPREMIGDLRRRYCVGSRHFILNPWPCSAGNLQRRIGNVYFIIHHRNGREIGNLSYFPEEREVVLLRGSILEVESLFAFPDGTLEIELREIDLETGRSLVS